MEIRIDDYISGGLLFSHPILKSDLSYDIGSDVPKQFTTLSDCFVKLLPDAWTFSTAKTDSANESKICSFFQISSNQLPDIRSWMDDHIDRGVSWWEVFSSLMVAKEFGARFLPGSSPIGIAIHKNYFSRYQAEADSSMGIGKVVAQGKPPETGWSEILGFEMRCCWHGQPGCSWLCNGVENALKPNHLTLNEFGLLGTFEDAVKATEWAWSLPDGKVLEPGLWLPWLLLRY